MNLYIKKATRSLLILCLIFFFISCNSFLDIVPDNVSTLDHSFSNALEAEKFLFTCYSFLPDEGTPGGNVGFVAGDEICLPEFGNHFFSAATWYVIAKGNQNTANPAVNYWDGFQEGKPLFKAIRQCNIFLENIENHEKVRDLSLDKRNRWISEVMFLKAYFHFYLLRMYGPIPLIKENLPVSATPEQVKIKQRPIDECVNYIIELLDDSNDNLPLVILNKNNEFGRITKAINRALKAKVLVTFASPLFNGNLDFSLSKNVDGEQLFNQSYDASKWEKATEAAKEAIETAESAGHQLYYYTTPIFTMSDTTLTQMSLRGCVTERQNNQEVIWGLTNSRAGEIQSGCMPYLHKDMSVAACYGLLAPTLKTVRQFYTHNGVPIEEDITLDYSNDTELRAANFDERVNFDVRYKTARINFDRENRFYAYVGFDGGKWLMSDIPGRVDYDAYVVKAKLGQISAGTVMGKYSETGYFLKKLVNWESNFSQNPSIKEYAWPLIRLADVYLMYAEALNELEGPTDEVRKYLDLVRKRAGLQPVVESWKLYTNNPSKPNSKDGMREIIHRERLNELAFEGSRFWDLRRWKKAASYLNSPITGWSYKEKEAEDYYQKRVIFQQKFISPRDYFWPIANNELMVNTNLVQNLGW